jgi:hypothetical protein
MTTDNLWEGLAVEAIFLVKKKNPEGFPPTMVELRNILLEKGLTNHHVMGDKILVEINV